MDWKGSNQQLFHSWLTKLPNVVQTYRLIQAQLPSIYQSLSIFIELILDLFRLVTETFEKGLNFEFGFIRRSVTLNLMASKYFWGVVNQDCLPEHSLFWYIAFLINCRQQCSFLPNL